MSALGSFARLAVLAIYASTISSFKIVKSWLRGKSAILPAATLSINAAMSLSAGETI